MNLIQMETLEESRSVPELRVGGFIPLTTIDYPGELSAVVFTQGCHLRCQYCQNSQLIPVHSGNQLHWDDVLAFLERRVGLLDAVVFSGGEPTLQKALPDAIKVVKRMGYKVGLHTVGSMPARLSRIIADVDWVGFDIKALEEDYPEITGVDKGKACWQSLRVLLESGVAHEVRTTVHWQLLPPETVLQLAKRLRKEGVQHFVLQNCRTQDCLNSALPPSALSQEKQQEIFHKLTNLFPFCEVR